MTALVLLSGGIDSAAALTHEIRAGREICAYHMILERTNLGHVPERSAVVKIIDAVQDDLTAGLCFWSSKINLRALGDETDNMIALVSITTNILIAKPQYTRLIIGWCAEEGEWGQRDIALFSIIREGLRYRGREMPQVECPTAKMTKAEMFEYVDPRVADAAWGCETPIVTGTTFSECGDCVTCCEYEAARQGRVLMGSGPSTRMVS